jgi:hypothetical protein
MEIFILGAVLIGVMAFTIDDKPEKKQEKNS